MWDDPCNPVGTVKGYNVYRVQHENNVMLKTKLNATLIPWVEDTEDTPRFAITDIESGQEFRVSAVGIDDEEGEISDDHYIVPDPPSFVPSFSVTEPPK